MVINCIFAVVVLLLMRITGNVADISTHGITSNYKPVVIVHGILDKKTSLEFMASRIQTAHPGTNVTVVDLLLGRHSLAPMWDQVRAFGDVIKQINEENPDGIHLLCYSQGGLICRGIIQSFSGLNVSTFVSLSSPQGGQYGDAFLRLMFRKAVKKTVHRIFYTSPGQRYSVANYWNDPHHQDSYFRHSLYLPRINNEIPTPDSSNYKNNFIKLNKLVLIGGPHDGVITPWQSSHFGCFDENEQVIPVENRAIYIDDLFGLKTLRKRTEIFTIPYVTHHEWHHNNDVIDNYILPYLN